MPKFEGRTNDPIEIVSFRSTPKERKLIKKIVKRALKLVPDAAATYLDLDMSLTACNANGCPLDFEKLLKAPDETLGHDVFGIHRFISKTTGQMPVRFNPRCSKPVKG